MRQPDHPRKLGEAVSPWRQGTGLIRGRMLGNQGGPEQQNQVGRAGHLEMLLQELAETQGPRETGLLGFFLWEEKPMADKLWILLGCR